MSKVSIGSTTSTSISKASLTRSSLKGAPPTFYGKPLPSNMRIASIRVYETKESSYEDYEVDADADVKYRNITDLDGKNLYILLVGSPLLYVIKNGDKWQVRNVPQYILQKGSPPSLQNALINGEILFPGCLAVTAHGQKYRYLGLFDPSNKTRKFFVTTNRAQNNIFLDPQMTIFNEVQVPKYSYAFDEQINTVNDKLGNSLFNSLDL